MVGIGLLQGMGKDELRAILAHEFGHFSQQTMKVGSITYRLLIIIRGMIEFAQDEQKKAVLSRSDNDSWSKLFHLASEPMVFITKQTIKFYNYIEKKNRSLSRWMEFEADSVACRIVGAKPFVSSLCKLEVLSGRYGLFENVVAKLLHERRYIIDYEKGYEIVEKLIADDENLLISYDTPLETLVSDEARFPSKVSIIDGWNTHPSTVERIENASQFMDIKTDVKYEDARTFVNTSIQSEIGLIRQHFICEHVDNPIPWNDMKEMSIEEFHAWVVEQFKNNRIPDFLFPFVNKKVVHFELPSEEKMEKAVESPFTKPNRDLILEFNSGLNDWQTLNELSSDNIKRFLYNGSSYEDVNQAIELHKQYLDGINDKLVDLEQAIFLYLCQQTGNKDNVTRIYWMIFYGSDSVNEMKDVLDLASAIKQQAQLYYENGQSFYLNNEVKNDLLQKLWDFLRSFDYEKVNKVCGSWTYGEEELVNKLLQQWHAFASTKCDYSIGSDALMEMIDGIYGLLVQLYNSGKSELAELMEQVVYHKKGHSIDEK